MAEKYDFMENFDKNNERFKGIIGKYFNDRLATDQKIVLGKCPPVFALANADISLDLVMDYETIDHIEERHFNKGIVETRLNVDDIKKIYESLINPICLFNGNAKDSFIVITDYKNSFNNNITIPIFINRKSGFINVNEIATEFSNSNILEYIIKETMKHNLIATNNKKLENLLRSIGLLLPKENTNISSDYNISQNNENVNKKLEDLLRPIGLLLPVEHISSSSYDDSIIHNTDNVKYEQGERLFKFNTDNKYFKPKFKANFEELNKATNELGWGHATQYFIFGEELSSVRKNEFLWDLKMLKHDTDRHQLENRLIENKTKEIEEKLKEIKVMLKKEEIKANDLKIGDGVSLPNIGVDKVKSIKIDELGKVNVSFENASMGYVFDKDDNITVFNDTSKTKSNVQNVIDVKEFIENNIKSYLQGNSYKDAITLDQKIVNQYEYLEKHFINDIKEQKGVGYHAAKGAALGLFMDDPTIESKLYPDYKGDVFEKYCKDCSIVFDDMYKQSKENLLKIREDIKEQLKETINDFNGKTFDEKMLNFYDYYKDTYEKQHDLSEDKGVGYNFAKDGNGACLIYYVDFREFYGYEKEKSSLDFKMYEEFRNYKDNIVPKENENLYNIYLKDVDSVCKEMYNEAFERIKENSKYGQAIKEVEEKDEKDTLLEDSKNIISDKQKEDKLNEVRDKNNDKDKEKSSKNSKGREE